MSRGYVAVVGPALASAEEVATATRVGALLAAAGCVVITGGGSGVMAAAAAGATGEGGVAVGILPGHQRAQGDPAHTILIPTGLGELRNGLIVRCADAVIAVGGSWGTQSEIALAARTGVPVFVIAGWPISGPGPHAAATAEEAVRCALDASRS